MPAATEGGAGATETLEAPSCHTYGVPAVIPFET